jgi:branched-subunit amino acid ABC-type transport system permease component
VTLQNTGLTPLLTVVVVAVTLGVGLALVDRVVFLPASRRGATNDRMLLVTVGVLHAVGGLLLLVWGNLPYTAKPFTAGEPLVVFGVTVQLQQLWVIGILLIAVVGLSLLLEKTELGLTMRATASRPEAARLVGVNTDRIRLIALSLSGVMAALAGAAIIPVTFLQFDSTTSYAVSGFIAAVVGGLGSVGGAVLGGLLLGVFEGIFSRYTGASLAEVTAIGLLIALLLVRPSGLLGRTAEVRR